MRHRCLSCSAEFPTGFHPFCGKCGGMVDVEYALDQVRLEPSANPYVRFAGLLPLTALHHRLPAASFTPMVHASRLGREISMPSLYLKDDTVLPTRSTKDHMAAVALAYLNERGVRTFCASSTGNSGTAFAYGIQAHPEMHLFLFTAEAFVPRVQHADHPQVRHLGMRDATFVEAAAYAIVFAQAHGLTSESGFFNPARREGLKLSFLEASEQLDQPIDWYVQAVSSAMGIYGAFKGAREMLQLGHIKQLPRMMCVQQESCAPMVRAFADGSPTIRPEHLVPRPTGIAEAILRGDPTRAYPHVRRVVIESHGGFVAVTEAEIRSARQRVEELEGLSPCFSASAAVAGVIKLAANDAITKDSVVVVNLTGADRGGPTQPSSVEWIERKEGQWNASAPATLQHNLATQSPPAPNTYRI